MLQRIWFTIGRALKKVQKTTFTSLQSIDNSKTISGSRLFNPALFFFFYINWFFWRSCAQKAPICTAPIRCSLCYTSLSASGSFITAINQNKKHQRGKKHTYYAGASVVYVQWFQTFACHHGNEMPFRPHFCSSVFSSSLKVQNHLSVGAFFCQSNQPTAFYRVKPSRVFGFY